MIDTFEISKFLQEGGKAPLGYVVRENYQAHASLSHEVGNKCLCGYVISDEDVCMCGVERLPGDEGEDYPKLDLIEFVWHRLSFQGDQICPKCVKEIIVRGGA